MYSLDSAPINTYPTRPARAAAQEETRSNMRMLRNLHNALGPYPVAATNRVSRPLSPGLYVIAKVWAECTSWYDGRWSDMRRSPK